MNKIITGASIIVVCCFSACAGSEQDPDPGLTNADYAIPAPIIPDSQNLIKTGTALPGSGQSVITPLLPPVANKASATPTAPGMNPAHGQPSHRCDIAVGAPLNSPATKPGAKTVSAASIPPVQTTFTPAQKTVAKTITPAGMNPQHGGPGHRCDIAVGAPLNSPVTKPPTQTVTPVPVPAPVIVPPIKDSVK